MEENENESYNIHISFLYLKFLVSKFCIYLSKQVIVYIS